MKKYILISLVVLVLGYAWIGYQGYKRIPRRTWEIKDVILQTSQVRLEQRLIWKLDLCRYTDKQYVAVNYIRNVKTGDAVLVNRVDDMDIQKGECKTIEQEGAVPFHTEAGESQLFVRLTTRDTPSELYPPVEAISKPFNIEK